MTKQLSKEELLDKIEKAAEKCEREIHGCGRCALSPLVQYLELGDKSNADSILKASLPMSGGICGTRNICGALLGGLMAIGMACLPGKSEEASPGTAMSLGRQYYRKFEKELGHTRCFDIRQVGLGRLFDTADPEEYEKFAKAGGYDLCGNVCAKAARLAAEFILEVQEEQKKG